MTTTNPPTNSTLSAIDRAIGCQHCGRELDTSPSEDFCSEPCQQAWQATHPVIRSGAEILDQVAAFLARFSVFPDEHCAPMLTLWYAHTHAARHFYVTPRLVLSSAEPGSGKTRVLEVAQFLVHEPEMTFNATTAAIFRMLANGPISLLFDEVDAIFNPKTSGNYEDLRALLNAGYKRTATVARCVGDAAKMKIARFPVYAPVALAGIAGGMPATITTRAITIHMRRRAPDEKVAEFRERTVKRQAEPLRDALAEWMNGIGEQAGQAEPAMPEGVTDRAREIWEPLIAIADTAGGHWPDTARKACTHFVHTASEQAVSLGVRLLADLRAVFTRHATDRMATVDIIRELCELDEAPWADLYGKPLDARRLAKELSRYNVTPTTYRHDGKATKGYTAPGPTGLTDAWKRYLPGETNNAPAEHGEEAP